METVHIAPLTKLHYSTTKHTKHTFVVNDELSHLAAVRLEVLRHDLHAVLKTVKQQ